MFAFCYFLTISFSYCIYTEPVVVSYPSVVERSTEMIIRYEAPNGPVLEAYEDTKGWSIGYGTKSYKGEVITRAEALARFKSVLHGSIHRVMMAYPDASEDQIVALTSLYYNCWSGWLDIRREGFTVMKRKDFCMVKGRDPNDFTGLISRRAEERKLMGLD